MRALGVTMLIWAALTFWWLGFARHIDELGVCGTGHPVQVAIFGYRQTDDSIETAVQPACQRQARSLAWEALFPAAGLLWAGVWLWGAEDDFERIDKPED